MRHALSVALCLLVAVPVDAQVRASSADQASADQDDYSLLQQQEQPEQQQQPTRSIQNSGRVADSAVGIVGQRQTREQMGYASPMGRIASRIPNRVQNRIRNRIDPSYDPQANAASPFLTAEDQARIASRGR